METQVDQPAGPPRRLQPKVKVHRNNIVPHPTPRSDFTQMTPVLLLPGDRFHIGANRPNGCLSQVALEGRHTLVSAVHHTADKVFIVPFGQLTQIGSQTTRLRLNTMATRTISGVGAHPHFNRLCVEMALLVPFTKRVFIQCFATKIRKRTRVYWLWCYIAVTNCCRRPG